MIWNMLLALPAQASRWALAGALLIMIGLLAACSAVPGGQPATGATGATKITGQRPPAAALSVDRTQIDFGKQPFGKPVKATFVLTNIGDKPLQILGEPAIRVVQGC
jgi:hypothetical protein